MKRLIDWFLKMLRKMFGAYLEEGGAAVPFIKDPVAGSAFWSNPYQEKQENVRRRRQIEAGAKNEYNGVTYIR